MQPCIDAKVCNLLGDERMSTFECDCGNVMPRYASHRPELIGMECSVCQTKWKTHAVKDENGQTKLDEQAVVCPKCNQYYPYDCFIDGCKKYDCPCDGCETMRSIEEAQD